MVVVSSSADALASCQVAVAAFSYLAGTVPCPYEVEEEAAVEAAHQAPFLEDVAALASCPSAGRGTLAAFQMAAAAAAQVHLTVTVAAVGRLMTCHSG